jgi:selenocysteine lyase/cysteine desulfurase
LLAGVTAAVDHIADMGEGGDRRSRLDDAYRIAGAHERALGERLLAGLADGVTVWGPQTMDGRVSTFALALDGLAPDFVSSRLGERGIFTWSGHNYAVEPMRRLGLLDSGGLVRIGLIATTTKEEVDRLLAELVDLLS